MKSENKTKILFIGQNPQRYTGNGGMLYMALQQVNKDKYDSFAMLFGDIPVELIESPFEADFDIPCEHMFLTGPDWGARTLLTFLEVHEIDQLIFVGIDIWRYAGILQQIKNISTRKGFLWKVIIPYDLPELRKDWLPWLQTPDQIFVYSEFGFNLLKDHVDNCVYYRPLPRYFDILTPATPEEKHDIRSKIFPDCSDDTIIIGFIGNNQLRKNVLRMMKGVSLVAKEAKKDIVFYMHMDQIKGIYDVDQLASDFDFPNAVVRHNGSSRTLRPIELAMVAKTFDLFLLPSLQEGLSWTVIEMALLGIPCLVSSSTAHLDYLNQGIEEISNKIFGIPSYETTELPLPTPNGVSYISAEACGAKDIAFRINKIINLLDKGLLKSPSEEQRQWALDWCKKADNINTVLKTDPKPVIKLDSRFGEVL